MMERVLYAAYSSDWRACLALQILSAGSKCEVAEIDSDNELPTTALPVIPVFTHSGNRGRFPSSVLRVLDTTKPDPDGREIPLPDFARSLASKSHTALALRELRSLTPDQAKAAMLEPLKHFHISVTGENICPKQPRQKKRYVRRDGLHRPYTCGVGWPYD